VDSALNLARVRRGDALYCLLIQTADGTSQLREAICILSFALLCSKALHLPDHLMSQITSLLDIPAVPLLPFKDRKIADGFKMSAAEFVMKDLFRSRH
jgi:hypothetical protein